MSIKVSITNLTDTQIETINKELTIRLPPPKYGGGITKYVCPFEAHQNHVYLPFSYAIDKVRVNRPPRTVYTPMTTKFVGSLRPLQEEVKTSTIQLLNKGGSALVSLYTGGGKSRIAIYIASLIKLPTLIVVNKIVLMTQWEKSINELCPTATVQKLTTKSKVNKGADFYIVNAINLPKIGRVLEHVGFVIMDEVHLLMAEVLSQCMQYVCPRYLLGLSATPYRSDGLNVLLDIYFGIENIVDVKLFKHHTVYAVRTGFKPPMVKTEQGRINWGTILDAQAKSTERNELIISIIKDFPTRKFLVLVKRIEQGEYICKRLTEEGESVTSLLGSCQTFDKEARTLVGTGQKVGTGFDHSSLDALILAGDVQEYFIQVLGRVFRREDVRPIIFDLVDDNSILAKHFKSRSKVYTEHGGVIEEYKKRLLVR